MLMDFWLGQGTKAVAIPSAGCRCFASPYGLPAAGCLPFGRLPRLSNAGQAKKTRNPSGESKKGRLAVLLAQLQPAVGMRLRERLAIRPFLLSRGFFLFISQVLSHFPLR